MFCRTRRYDDKTFHTRRLTAEKLPSSLNSMGPFCASRKTASVEFKLHRSCVCVGLCVCMESSETQFDAAGVQCQL